MKKLILLLLPLALSVHAVAQTGVAYSEPFEEIRDGADHFVQFKDGRTVYINTSEEGINVKSYDGNHKLIVQSKNSNDIWTDRKFSASHYKGAFAVGDKVAMFMTMLNRGNMLTLHRIDIDPATAKVIKAEQLSEIPTRRSWGETTDGMVMNDYYVEQDPVTGNYAIATCECYTRDKDDKVIVSVYDITNKSIKQATLNTGSKTVFVQYGDMCMYNNNVYISITDYDGKLKGMAVPIYISALKDGSNEFVTQKLVVKPLAMTNDVQLFYNTGNKQLQILTNTETGSESKGSFGGNTTVTKRYGTILTLINAEDLSLISSSNIPMPKTNQYSRTKVGDKDGFGGVLPTMHLNNDNSITLLPKTMYSRTFNGSTTYYEDQLGIVYLDNAGAEKEGYTMRIPETSGSIYANTDGLKKAYVSTPGGNYIIMNDLPENIGIPEKEQPHKMTGVSDANTMLCKIGEGKIEKSYLFGEPGKKTAKFSYPGSGYFDKETNTYITVMVQNEKGDKKSYIAWVKF